MLPTTPSPPGQATRVTTDISPLTPLTLLLMTSMPEAASPPVTGLVHPREPLGQIFCRGGCSRDGNLGIRSFPSRRPFFPALLYSLVEEKKKKKKSRNWPFLSFPLCLSLLHDPPFSSLASFSSAALSLRRLRCSCRPDPRLPPFFTACSSIPLSWDLARERLSSYIEKSGGRLKNWRYLYHPLCFTRPYSARPVSPKKPCI